MAIPPEQPGSLFRTDARERSFPRLQSSRRDPRVEAVISKLVGQDDSANRNAPTTPNANKRKEIRPPDTSMMQRLVQENAVNIQDASSLFQLLPDTELSMQILVSSIISPKDMLNTEIGYTVDQAIFNSPITNQLIEVVRSHFDNVYKIRDLLPKMLQDSLFFTGSYPLMVVAESAIDDVINSKDRVSMESLNNLVVRDVANGMPMQMKSLGLLGNRTKASETKASMESLFHEPESPSVYDGRVHHGAEFGTLLVTDNPDILKVDTLVNRVRSERVNKRLETYRNRDRVSTESQHPAGSENFYRARRYRTTPIVSVPAIDQVRKPTVGHPTTFKLPSESVIPVHVPGSPDQHLGYFVVLDEFGHPINKAQESDYYTQLAGNLSNGKQMISQLIAQTDMNTAGKPVISDHPDVAEMTRLYGDIVEQDLVARLRNGDYGSNAVIARSEELYRIMFARALQKMNTQMLYVPRELMTYVAFDYNKFGVGISLLQSSKILAGLRAMMLFANTMSSIKNSIGHTVLNIQLDSKDPDPSGTVEFLYHEYGRTRQTSFPLGSSNPNDIITWMQNAGVEVAVSGNAGYPETKMAVEDRVSNRPKVDTELENDLRKRHLMALGLSPEMVDAGFNTEFAAQTIQNNVLLSKRVLAYQRSLMGFAGDHIRKYTVNSETLMSELRALIRDNWSKLSEDEMAQIKRTDERLTEQAENGRRGTDGAELQAPTLEEGKGRTTRVTVREDEVMLDDGDDHTGTAPRHGERTQRGAEPSEEAIDEFLLDFIQALEPTLPSPDTSSLESQMKSYDEYVEALKKCLEAYLSPEFLDENGLGDCKDVLPQLIAGVEAHFKRQWLRNNNVMAELDDLTTLTDEGAPTLDVAEVVENHGKNLAQSIRTYVIKLLKDKQTSDRAYHDGLKAAGVKDDTIDTSGGDSAVGGSDEFGSSDAGGDLNLPDEIGDSDETVSDTGDDSSASDELTLPDETADAGSANASKDELSLPPDEQSGKDDDKEGTEKEDEELQLPDLQHRQEAAPRRFFPLPPGLRSE